MDMGPGSTGNVIAALCSFFVPELGQLVQGRLLAALLFVIVAGCFFWVWFFGLGWIIHVWAALDAAWYKPKA